MPVHPKLKTVQDTPPVYEIPGFLSDDECATLIAAAEGGKFPAVPVKQSNRRWQ